MADDIQKFLDENKLKFRKTEDHFQVDCFLCNDTKERLGIDQKTGGWKCFNCSSFGGKLSTLEYAFKHKTDIVTKNDLSSKDKTEKKCTIKKDLHLRFFTNIKKTKRFKTAKYLQKERKISKKAIIHFKLGARKTFINKDKEKYDAGEHLAIPYLIDGKCVNVKYRSLDPEVDKKFKWKREKGGITALFNGDILNNLDYDEVFITESEIDCISLWELGIKNVLGLTAGCDSFKQSWVERLKRFKKIYLVLDNDIPGQEGALKIAKRLGLDRTYNILLPEDIKDPNDFIKKHTLELFNKLIKKGSQFKVRGARGLKDMMQNLYNKRFVEDQDEVVGFVTPWKKINKILGPLRPGHLFILAGKPKSGKSSLALNLMRFWGNNNISSGMYSCEMNELRIAEKFTTMEIGTLRTIEDAEPLDIVEAMYKLPMHNMEFYYPTRSELTGDKGAIDKVLEKIVELVQRYGLKIFIFDNLHFLCRGDDDKAMIDYATQQFKLMAEELEILLILVTHPRKTNNNKQLKTDDLKGSSSIFQDADIVWLMHRSMNDGDMTPDEIKNGNKSGAMSDLAQIAVFGRWTEGGKGLLRFDGARSSFTDKGKHFHNLLKTIGKAKTRPKGI